MSNVSQASASGAIESVLAAKEGAVGSKIAYKLAAKTLDSQRAMGDAAIALLDAASPRGAAEGKGGSLDLLG